MKSTLRLFKALPIESKVEVDKDRTAELMEQTIPLGFVFEPVFSSRNFTHIIKEVNDLYGRNPEELNSSFHKSFSKVRDASISQLAFEQVTHYLTTYGAEMVGVYNQDSVYIPHERLDIPQLKEDIRLVVIHGLTKEELKVKLLELLSSGIALSEQSVKDAIDIAQYTGMDAKEIELITNKEVKSALYDYFDIVPQNPVEFLRYVVYRSTDKTLLIKNKELIKLLNQGTNSGLVKYFNTYEKLYGLEKLAEIFYRFKPIFLAMRTNSSLKRSINKIRRLAKTHHKPMPEDLLNSITYRLETHNAPDADTFRKAMADTNVFRKIRLAYALKFRTTDSESIVYKVRNGKSFAKEFSFENKHGAEIMYKTVLKYILEDIRPNVEGKSFFIPEGLTYALPASEKQFTGDIPSGSFVELKEDMVVGVHWLNTGKRVDLDLSLTNLQSKIGWDSLYRNKSREILFSGDVTDAPEPKGASELFYIGTSDNTSWLLSLNYYNHRLGDECPFKLFVAQSSPENINKNYMVDTNKIIAASNSSLDKKQTLLGIVKTSEQSKRFYFVQTGLKQCVSYHNSEYSDYTRKFFLDYYTNTVTLNEILELAGAKVVNEMTEGVIDLSPEAVDRTTFINLLGEKHD